MKKNQLENKLEKDVLKDVSFGPKNFKLDNPEERAKQAMNLFKLGEKFYQKNPFLAFYGTGSYPEPPQGWQRIIRLIPIHPPLKIPYFITASTIYWLHVGVKRHAGGVKGDMHAR